jgi:endonuclease/exonuclease/phosphatase (EEP) superfamily protein YafD
MASVLAFLLHMLVAFVAVATALAIVCARRPWLGIPQHWGLQLWQLSLIALIGSIWSLDLPALAMSGAVAAYWSWRLWPRKVPPAAAGNETLRIVSANLLHQNGDFERAPQIIGSLEPDVIVLCETTPAARAAFRALEAQFPHAIDTCVPDGLYGIVVLSRFPFRERSRAIGDDAPPRHLAVDLDIGARRVTLVMIHPTNPLRFSRAHRVPGEFEAVAQLCRAAPDDLILIGDCNAAGWSHWLQQLERATGLKNDRRVRPSWPVWLPHPLRLPLDHVWVRGNVVLQRAALGPRFGSDHLPLVVDVGWKSDVRDQMPEVRNL